MTTSTRTDITSLLAMAPWSERHVACCAWRAPPPSRVARRLHDHPPGLVARTTHAPAPRPVRGGLPRRHSPRSTPIQPRPHHSAHPGAGRPRVVATHTPGDRTRPGLARPHRHGRSRTRQITCCLVPKYGAHGTQLTGSTSSGAVAFPARMRLPSNAPAGTRTRAARLKSCAKAGLYASSVLRQARPVALRDRQVGGDVGHVNPVGCALVADHISVGPR